MSHQVTPIHDLPFDMSTLHTAYRNGLDAQTVIAECLRRIEAAGDPGIFLHLADRETVLADVAALGAFAPDEKPLWGLPFAIKDNIDAANMPTTAACPQFAYQAEADAFVVAALRKAGAILIGKTNLDQFATGLVGVRSPYPVPVNPIDPLIPPGGSSCGSAVAVARGLVTFALGTDTAGSGRVPAALNNIVGLKPTLGALSNTGVVPACRTLDTVSVLALTVDDAWHVFRAAALFDPEDAYARPITLPPAPAMPPPHLRIGVPDAVSRRFFGDRYQEADFDATLERLTKLGATIVAMDFSPFFDVAAMLYEGAWVAERLAAVETFRKDHPDALHPVTETIIGGATDLSAADAFRGFYRLKALKRKTGPLVACVDLIAVPTIPAYVTLKDLEDDPIGPNSQLGTYTNFVNLLDLCGIAVPTGKRGDGRPGSLTLLAPRGRDAEAAGVASLLLHSAGTITLGATDWPLPVATGQGHGSDGQAAVGEDEILIAAVGAHMSGLPLNGELTRLGARFVREDRTSTDYRFYKLAGGPPARPGLIRVDSDGRSIALELWAMPKTAFGTFMAGIPMPLGIGTLTLQDGTQVKGFLCEEAGLAGAEDITDFGGWRGWLASLESAAVA